MNQDLPEMKSKRNIIYTLTDEDKEHTTVQISAEGFGIAPEDKVGDVEKDTNTMRMSRMISETIYSFCVFMHDLGMEDEHVINTIKKINQQLKEGDD